MRAIAVITLFLTVATTHLQALSADSPVIGTWTGTLCGVMRNPTFVPTTQRVTSDVTLVATRIANGNPDQDGNYILSLYVWGGLKIGGPPDNGSLSSIGMHMPEPVGTRFGALGQTQHALMTLTLIGQMTSANRMTIDGHFLTQWTTHDFTITARRYRGPVDENGFPVLDTPNAISVLERRYPWYLPQDDGLFLELAKSEASGG